MDFLIGKNVRLDSLRLYPKSEEGLAWLDEGGYCWLIDDSGVPFVPFTLDFWDEKPLGLRYILDEAGLTYQFA